MQSTPPVAAMVNGVARSLVRRVRLECLAVLASQALSFWVLDLRLGSWLVLYGMHGLLWSSQNYVNHSGSPRRVADGAHNLVTHWLHERLILNFNWHLAHHQHPNVPWHLLPRFDDASRVRPGYLSNLLRFWRGPRETTEPSPRPEHDSVFVP
jgi:fatty acid desaturase